MKIAYFPDTKTLDITFAEGVILSRDERGIVGLTIENTDVVPGFDPSVLVDASTAAT